MDSVGFLSSWLMLIVPQPCFDKFFIDFDFFNGVCLKIVISKCIGYAIILGSTMVKLPQVAKLKKSRRADGIHVVSVFLELMAITFSLAYGFASGFPFSAYGEGLFIAVQTWLIAYLVLYYGGNQRGGLVFSAVYGLVVFFLLSPFAPPSLLWFLQASIMPNLVVARMIQAYTNYQNGTTGQLSAVTAFLLFAGALARVFTSVQETGDPIIVWTFVTSSACNGIIAFQIVYYWNATKQKSA